MFCVIQSIALKKQQTGYPKRLLSEWLSYSIAGTDAGYYYHHQSLECFLRPIRQAFRISIHESFRAAGTVKKRQFPICTVNYYDLATDFFSLFEWGDTKIRQAAEALEVSEERLYCLIEAKLTPLRERIQAEFAQTEEFQEHEKQMRILDAYAAKKAAFCKEYDLDPKSEEYDRCYDVFGTLGHPEHLKRIQEEYQARLEYERQREEYRRRYFENFQNNYGGESRAGSTKGLRTENQDEAEQEIYKQFYRTLSKKYHPDANPGKDTSKEMKVLNQLKQT